MLKYKNVREIWLMGFVSLLQWEKVARFTATDEVLLYVYCQSKPYLAMFALKLLPKAQPPCLGDADTHASHMC